MTTDKMIKQLQARLSLIEAQERNALRNTRKPATQAAKAGNTAKLAALRSEISFLTALLTDARKESA